MEEKEKNIIDNNMPIKSITNKKINIILLLNLILFIGLIILYVLYFNCKREAIELSIKENIRVLLIHNDKGYKIDPQKLINSIFLK